MKGAGARAIFVAVGCLFVSSPDMSAFAGTRLYDMNRMLSEPHPYGNGHPTTSSGAAPPVPALRNPAPVSRTFDRTQTPLPGSQYRLQLPGVQSTSGGASSIAISGQQMAGADTPRPVSRENTTGRSYISEIVLGGFVHDPGQDNNEANSADLNLEIIFRKVTLLTFENRYLRFLFSPNPIVGGTINSDNETHTAYLAMNWQYRFESDWFVAGSFGFTYHTGNLDQAEENCPVGTTCSLPGNRRFVDTGDVTLGSRILFRESVELGYWVAERHGLSLYFAHMSNASIFDEDNDGMNFLGLRYRYAFD
jgi:hypothetical protein